MSELLVSIRQDFSLPDGDDQAAYDAAKKRRALQSATGWQTAFLTPEELATHIVTGPAFCPGVFRDNHRKTDNFLSAQCIALDFDNGPDIDTLSEHPIIKKHALLIAASPSHGKPWVTTPKMRVIFALDQTIIEGQEYERLVDLVLTQFPDADSACSDCARFFFGCQEPAIVQPDNVLPVSLIESWDTTQENFGEISPKSSQPPTPHTVIQYPTSDLEAARRNYAEHALQDELRKVSGAHEGIRNNTLNEAAFNVGTLVGAGVLNQIQVENDLTTAAAGVDLPQNEALRTIQNGIEAGMKTPRDLSHVTPHSNGHTPTSNGHGPQVVTTDRQPQPLPPASVDMSTLDPKPRFNLLTVDQLYNLPPVQYLADGMLVRQGFNVLYGQSGEGKSFIALDMALHIAEQEPVVFVAGEGATGNSARVKAWYKHHRKNPGNVRFLTEPVQLLDPLQVGEFIAIVKQLRPALIVLDTLARCMVGGEENSAKDMGRAIEACNQIQRETGAAVLLVHHSGKTGLSERGSSALRGAADMMIEVTADESIIKIACSKAKDSAGFSPRYVQLMQVEIAPDVTSCVVMPSGKMIEDPDAVLTDKQMEILDILMLEQYLFSGVKYTQLKAAVSFSEATMQRVISKLMKREYITKEGKYEPYCITSDGMTVYNANIQNIHERSLHVHE